MVFSFGVGLPMWSDVYIKLMNETYMSEQTLLRFGFNTAFIVKNKLILYKKSVSPEALSKDSRFDEDFSIELTFDDYCKNCSEVSDLNDQCINCISTMGDEWVTWKKLTYLLSTHKIPSKEEAEHLHFKVVGE